MKSPQVAVIGTAAVLGVCGVIAAAVNPEFVSFEGFIGMVIAAMLAGIFAKLPEPARQDDARSDL